MKTEFNNDDRKLLLRYWQAFHQGFVSKSDVTGLRIMREKFVSNKAYDKYDLFIPNNLK
jgi:hypothetical protein